MTLAAHDAEASPDTITPPTNVIEAILAVMRSVRAVGKDGYNEQHRFNFRGIDGVVNALGPALRDHGVVVLPNLVQLDTEQVETGSKRTLMNWTRVQVEYRFYGPGGPTDVIAVTTPGESFDSGDKGTAKAMSVAFRTALLQAFALPTQERDPDADSHEIVKPLTGQELEAEVEGAVATANRDGRDPVHALKEVWDSHGEGRLVNVTVEVNGRPLDGAAYINAWVNRVQREQDETRAGSSDEDAERAVSVASSGARSDDQARATTSAQPEPARAPAQERARETAPAVREDRRFVPLRDEISGQADTLGVPPGQHIEPLLAVQQGATKVADLPAQVVLRWVADQRPRVIEALRGQGRATEADRYAQVPSHTPLMWGSLAASQEDRQEAAHAPSSA
ncbi:MAG: ERF family protein [Phycicoccus sp.]